MWGQPRDLETLSTVIFQVPAKGIRRREFRMYAKRLQVEVAEGTPFTCMITGDEDLQRWNKQFRKKNYPTDVLTFPSGEIAISFDRAKEQAAEFGHSAEEEIRILLLHGVLHLKGMDHERDRGEMARAERRWRKYFSLPLGLIERVHS
jgi:probable rRNA maturation factor